MAEYLEYFPRPLLDDLVTGRWLPIVGAGMSRNALVPAGKHVPLWDELGRQLAADLPDYPFAGALDAVSAYAHEFGRPRMVERVAEALLINDARPGDAHRAFCSILFDIVCTTNVDFLLERQYESTSRYCRPIIDEDHLSVNHRTSATALLKLHGDLHHPARLVLTEEDYDAFLERFPLLATYLANLLITRTAVLIGYSLDDPDFRQIWQVVGERLGSSRRLAYALVVDAKGTDIARFARRGVKVINLPGSRTKYDSILASALDELREYVQTHLLPVSHVTEDEPLSQFALPQEAITRLCFFAVPLGLLPQYRDQVFPRVEQAGLVPVTAADVIGPGENFSAKIDAMMRRSVAVVVDVSTENTRVELGMATTMRRPPKTLVILEADAATPSDAAGILVVRRDKRPFADQGDFLTAIDDWLGRIAAELEPRLAEEPVRLLAAREYRAAVISAMTQLEAALRAEHHGLQRPRGRAYALGSLADFTAAVGLLTEADAARIKNWMRLRNLAVHSQEAVSRGQATEVVNGVLEIINLVRTAR